MKSFGHWFRLAVEGSLPEALRGGVFTGVCEQAALAPSDSGSANQGGDSTLADAPLPRHEKELSVEERIQEAVRGVVIRGVFHQE